jgi:hypothetical protein
MIYNQVQVSTFDMTPNLFSNLNRRKFIGLSTLFLLGACGAQTTQPTASGKSKIVFWTMQLKPQFDNYRSGMGRYSLGRDGNQDFEFRSSKDGS